MIFNPITYQLGVTIPDMSNPAGAGQILSGFEAVNQDGALITGNIPGRSASNLSVSGAKVTVPAGHYPSQVSKSVASATQATPSVSVNSSGLVTASCTQSAGYVAKGTKSATHQLTTQSGKTITPGTSQQTAVASGRYTTGNVYVAGDADLVPANIKSGVNIFGVSGTYKGLDPIQNVIQNGRKMDVDYIGYQEISPVTGPVQCVVRFKRDSKQIDFDDFYLRMELPDVSGVLNKDWTIMNEMGIKEYRVNFVFDYDKNDVAYLRVYSMDKNYDDVALTKVLAEVYVLAH